MKITYLISTSSVSPIFLDSVSSSLSPKQIIPSSKLFVESWSASLLIAHSAASSSATSVSASIATSAGSTTAIAIVSSASEAAALVALVFLNHFGKGHVVDCFWR